MIAERIQEVFIVGKAHVEADLVTKSKRKIPYYFTGFQMVIDGNKYLLGIGVDISIQKQAEDRLREIAGEIKRKWPVHNVGIYHRVGELKVGDINLVVTIASAHREEGFAENNFSGQGSWISPHRTYHQWD